MLDLRGDGLNSSASALWLASLIAGGNGARLFFSVLWYVPLVLADEQVEDNEFVDPRKSLDLDRDDTLP